MEPYRPPAYPAFIGDATYVGALALFIYLQRLAVKLRSEEGTTWWASNGRDVVNAFAVVTVSGAIWLQGIAAPLALLLGATLTLALTVVNAFLQQRSVPEPWRLVLVTAAVLGAPLVFAPRATAQGADRLLGALFGGG